MAVDSSGRFTGASVAPDGRKVAVVRDGDVWIYDLQRKVFSRLTQTEQLEANLTWSPDSREVFYVRDVPQYDIFKRSADGSRPEERVITSANDKIPESISPDGKVLLFHGEMRRGFQWPLKQSFRAQAKVLRRRSRRCARAILHLAQTAEAAIRREPATLRKQHR